VTGTEDNQFSVQPRQNYDEESLLKSAALLKGLKWETQRRPRVVISPASQSRDPRFKSPYGD
jgi:hypothetical protein